VLLLIATLHVVLLVAILAKSFKPCLVMGHQPQLPFEKFLLVTELFR